MLQWLRAHGCPWDEETCKSTLSGRQEVACKRACAREGVHEAVREAVVLWALANGCPPAPRLESGESDSYDDEEEDDESDSGSKSRMALVPGPKSLMIRQPRL